MNPETCDHHAGVLVCNGYFEFPGRVKTGTYEILPLMILDVVLGRQSATDLVPEEVHA